MAVPKKKTSKMKGRSRMASAWRIKTSGRSTCPRCDAVQPPAHRLWQLRLVRRPAGRRGGLSEHDAPRRRRRDGRRQGTGEIVAGARQAVEELGIPVLLVGRPEELGDTGDLEVLPASEVIAMDADPAKSVRRMKDSSLVRAAEAVRDGKASAMVSAGNTGATMGSAPSAHGPHQGRQPAGHRHADPSLTDGHPTVMLDAGANAECLPEMLVQFAVNGRGVRPPPVRDRGAEGGALSASARRPPRGRCWSRRPTPCCPTGPSRASGRPSSATSRGGTSWATRPTWS